MDERITSQHWAVFQYYDQEKRGVVETAEIMNLTPDKVMELMAELRQFQPELFPTDREKYQFGATHPGRKSQKIVSFTNIDEESIKETF